MRRVWRICSLRCPSRKRRRALARGRGWILPEPRRDGPGAALQQRRGGDLPLRGGARLLDPPDLRDDAMVEGTDRLVVGGHGRAELAPDLAERLGEAAQPAVQLARR